MRSLRGERGTTLVEALAALVILAIGLVGVIGCLTMALQTNQKAKHTERATAIAQDTIEEMRSLGFGAITADEFPATESLDNLPSGVRTIGITYPYNGDSRLKHVEVDIAWHSANNTTSHVTVATIVSNRTEH